LLGKRQQLRLEAADLDSTVLDQLRAPSGVDPRMAMLQLRIILPARRAAAIVEKISLADEKYA
jgi:hypothetical protein